MRVGLLVPTLNAGASWPTWIAALARQTAQPHRTLVIDSSSTDNTAELAHAAGFEVRQIERTAFDHGGTRQLGIEMLGDCDVIICLTQDAVLADDTALASLASAFADQQVAAAYGRQLPHSDASPLGSHARHFNYPAESRLLCFNDRHRLGIRAAFCSNSFSAWRRQALMEVGGFPAQTLLGEDMLACARLLMTGHAVAYVASAQARHSHNYTPAQELRRYFDTGAMHAMTPWLGESFGRVGGEGLRFVRSEWQFLRQHRPIWRARSILNNGAKWLGYQLGRYHAALPSSVKLQLSMHPAWWRRADHELPD